MGVKLRFLLVVLLLLLHGEKIFSQPIENILARNDKHFLGGGQMVIWAPEYPLFLDYPGFWDHAMFLDYEVAPVFTVTFLDENLKEIPLTVAEKNWVPSHLTVTYEPSGGLEIVEQKALLPRDVLVSNFSIKNNSSEKSKKIYIIIWTSQNIQSNADREFPEESRNANYIHNIFNSRSRISWERKYNNRDGKLEMKIGMALGGHKIAKTTSVNVSDKTWNYPHWKLTPFFEKMTSNGLPPEENFEWRMNPDHFSGLIYFGMQYEIDVAPNSNSDFSAYCAIAPSEQEAIEAFDDSPKQRNPIQASVENWDSFFEKVPSFKCSDSYFEKYFYYRWYGLRLNMINTDGRFNLPNPCVFEGVNKGWFRHHISYSAQAHILETRWMHQPDVAMGSLLNFIEHQKPDGSFPGLISMRTGQENKAFYHANWGRAIRELYRNHSNMDFLQRAYEALGKYARYFEQERDKEGMFLYDVRDQWETGQEYNSRYLFADHNSDKGGEIQLKGIDVSVYIYELQKNLAWMAKELSKSEESAVWNQKANKTGEAIRNSMWHDQLHFFVDVKPGFGEQSRVKNSVGFHPFFTDLVRPEHLSALTEHLFNPNEFWTDYPLPSTSLDDANANIFGDWKDKRRNCPWNGRSWLMTTSHVCEALAHSAQNMDEKLKPQAVEILTNFVRMLFADGDVNRPTSYEYYNPFDGKPPYFRGTDDYMHSWINDLIIKYVAGLQPGDGNKIVVDPLPFNLESFVLDNVMVKGRLIKILWKRNDSPVTDKGLYIFVDGKLIKRLDKLARFEFNL